MRDMQVVCRALACERPSCDSIVPVFQGHTHLSTRTPMPSSNTLDTVIHGITCALTFLCLLSISEYTSKAVKHLREIRDCAVAVEEIAQCDHQDKWAIRTSRAKNACYR